MHNTNRIALYITASMLPFGFLADRLLKQTPWGANVLIVALLFCGLLFGLARLRSQPLSGGARYFAIPALLFAGLFALRDTPTLTALNFLALSACLGLMIFRSASGRIVLAGLREFITGVAGGWLGSIFGVFPLLAVAKPWRALRPHGHSSMIGRALLGLAIALPLLLIFGILFSAADANFEQLLRDSLSFRFSQIFLHGFITLLLAALAGGALYTALIFNRESLISTPSRPTGFGLGTIETGIVLGLLNLLFAAFVVVQLRYFFGGAALVLDTADQSNTLTFAEYARRGFFELVTVSTLVLIMLLIGNWLVSKTPGGEPVVFRALALLLIGLLFVIMASALHRMGLYVQVYGLTELRVYTSVFMLWLAIVFVWFIVTILRGREHGQRFGFGFVSSGLAVLFALNLANPVERIASANIERLINGAAATSSNTPFASTDLDAAYLADLGAQGADAVPPLMANFSRLPSPADRCVVADSLVRYYEQHLRDYTMIEREQVNNLPDPLAGQRPADWRSWNLSRATARAWLTPEWQAYFQTQANCGGQ